MIRIAIDGACRRNGKPDCVASGSAFIKGPNACSVIQVHEYRSTNQSGELLALIAALQYLGNQAVDAQIITDSEYLFNAMTNEWPKRWSNTGWKTSSGGEVKNRDLWEQVISAAAQVTGEVAYYHIKGHCVPFGKVTAEDLVRRDPSGEMLYMALNKKFDAVAPTKAVAFEDAQNLSDKNNGFRLPKEIFREFVVLNSVADIFAVLEVEAADREI